jgi:hypothetical protein
VNRDCIHPGCTLKREHKTLCRGHRLQQVQKTGIGFIDSTPAREKIALLQERGWSFLHIGAAADVPPSTVRRIARGVGTRAYGPTVKAIAAIEVTEGRWIDSTGTARRLQALVRIGWSYDEISRRSGVNDASLRIVQTRPRVAATTASAVAAVYDDLYHTDGPSTSAMAAGRRCGFAPPDAWDETTIDDPDAEPWAVSPEPDPVLVERVVAGRFDRRESDKVVIPRQEWEEAIRCMVRLGVTPSIIAMRVRSSSETVQKWIARHRDEVPA